MDQQWDGRGGGETVRNYSVNAVVINFSISLQSITVEGNHPCEA